MNKSVKSVTAEDEKTPWQRLWELSILREAWNTFFGDFTAIWNFLCSLPGFVFLVSCGMVLYPVTATINALREDILLISPPLIAMFIAGIVGIKLSFLTKEKTK